MRPYLAFIEKYSPVPLTAWQREDIRGALSHRFSFLVWPSGYGKTTIAALIIAARLIVSKQRLASFGASGDEDQALLLHANLDEIFTHADLLRLVHKTTNTLRLKHAPRSEHRTLTTHAATTWGITPTDLTIDEVAEATPAMQRMFYALISSLRKRKDSRVTLITSPGFRDTFAHGLLQDVRDDPRWFISERTEANTPRPAWLDPEQDLYRRILPAPIYEAKHQGEWAEEGGGVLDRAKIEAVFTAELPEETGNEARGVDLAISRDQAVIARVQRIESLFYVVGLHSWTAKRGEKIDLTEIESEIILLNQRRAAPWVFDPWQSVLMCQQLRKQGVQVKEFIFTSEARRRLFSRVLDLIESGRLKCRPHPELKKQLVGLSVKRLPSGAWRIDHRPGQRDDLIVAVGLALDALPDYADAPSLPMGAGVRASGSFRDFIDAPLPDAFPGPGRGWMADW